MSDDLWWVLFWLLVGVAIGVGVGVLLRVWCPVLSARFAAWSESLPWWMFLSWAVLFLVMAAYQVSRGWWWFAAVFAAFATLEVVCMSSAIRRRMRSPGLTTGGAPQRTTPEA